MNNNEFPCCIAYYLRGDICFSQVREPPASVNSTNGFIPRIRAERTKLTAQSRWLTNFMHYALDKISHKRALDINFVNFLSLDAPSLVPLSHL